MSETPVLVDLADDACQAIRRVNHLTVRGPAVPAPQLYEVLGSLKQLGAGLEQALTQLGDALEHSFAEYQVYEAASADPASAQQPWRRTPGWIRDMPTSWATSADG